MMLHGSWNLMSVTLAQDEPYFILYGYFAVFMPIFLCMVGVVLWLRSWRGAADRADAAEYARRGWFSPPEVAALGTLGRRLSARRWARRVAGDAGRQAMRAYQFAATRLALLRDGHEPRPGQRRRSDRIEAVAEERHLLDAIDAYRKVFVGRDPNTPRAVWDGGRLQIRFPDGWCAPSPPPPPGGAGAVRRCRRPRRRSATYRLPRTPRGRGRWRPARPGGRDRVHVALAQQDVVAALQLHLGAVVRVEQHPVAGTIARTCGPTPTAVAQDRRRPTDAVAGITMPAACRRSPSPPSSRTRTRSCSSRIGRPASTSARGRRVVAPGNRRLAGCHGCDATGWVRAIAAGPGLRWGPGRTRRMIKGVPWAGSIRCASTCGGHTSSDSRRPAGTGGRRGRGRSRSRVELAAAAPATSIRSPLDDEPRRRRGPARPARRRRLVAGACWSSSPRVAVLLWLVGRLRTVLVPLSIALLLSALLAPMMGFLRRG